MRCFGPVRPGTRMRRPPLPAGSSRPHEEENPPMYIGIGTIVLIVIIVLIILLIRRGI